MKKIASLSENSTHKSSEIDSQTFTNIIMQGKSKEELIRFLLNNSHLQRHGYIKNFSLKNDDEIVSIASIYENNDYAYLCNVFTTEKHRSKGRAKELILDVTDINKECHLICSEELTALYKKCGFLTYAKWIEYLY